MNIVPINTNKAVNTPTKTYFPIKQSFCGIKYRKTTLGDIFSHSKIKYLDVLEGIRAGEYGTICDGSAPLSKFFHKLNSAKDIKALKKLGLSTNDIGCAYSFLKAKANRPLSTSFVHDCSVMYLYNKNNNTHFLYHIHKDENEKEISAIIKLFMPEGYSHASIVPGDKYWTDTHKRYLPEIFSAIQKGDKNAKISVFHASSQRPEIVGYMGKMYEISNKFYLQPLSKRLQKGERGQATFPIRDFRIYSTIYDSNSATDIKKLQKRKHFIKHSAEYTPELRQILYRIIDERINGLKELEKIKSSEELDQFLKTKDMDYLFGYPQIGKAGYLSAVNNKKNELRIMQ